MDSLPTISSSEFIDHHGWPYMIDGSGDYDVLLMINNGRPGTCGTWMAVKRYTSWINCGFSIFRYPNHYKLWIQLTKHDGFDLFYQQTYGFGGRFSQQPIVIYLLLCMHIFVYWFTYLFIYLFIYWYINVLPMTCPLDWGLIQVWNPWFLGKLSHAV